jgi:aldose 1-epimerase
MHYGRNAICTTLLATSWLTASALAGEKVMSATRIDKSVFGKASTGQEVLLYTLTNSTGAQVGITPWGATVTSIRVPDRSGKLGDIVLGFDTLQRYIANNRYFGAIVGRYGNRIANGKFMLDGKAYALARNNGENHLHGGIAGFDKKLWDAREVPGANGPALELKYTSPAGEEGYPGQLDVTVSYTLTNANELRIDYLATTDQPTVVNLTNHSYFNLAGAGDVLAHRVQIHAARFTPVDAGLIPTGELRSVTGTPFDFTTAHSIGERIDAGDEQIKFGKGYDHNWVLDGIAGQLRLAARVSEPSSGRVLEVLTTEPGLQFYSGNFLDGTNHGKGGQTYLHRAGFCMETQHFPDAPNKPSFASTTLLPGQRYQSTTLYRFSTDNIKLQTRTTINR